MSSTEVIKSLKEAGKRKKTLDVMTNLKEVGKRKITLDEMMSLNKAKKMTKSVVAATAKIIAIAAAETGNAKKSAINAWKSSSEVKMNLKEDGKRKITLGEMMSLNKAKKRMKGVVAAGAVAVNVEAAGVVAVDVVAATDLKFETS